MQIYPSVTRQTQCWLAQQGPVRDHRAAVDIELSCFLQKFVVGRFGRIEDLDSTLSSKLGNRRRLQCAAAAGPGVRTGQDGDHVVVRTIDQHL